MKKKLLLSLFLASVFLSSFFSQSQVIAEEWKSEKINSYHTELTVLKNGELLVEETIKYDFGDYERQGIFRDIPYGYFYDEEVSVGLDLIGVTNENGEKYKFEDSLFESGYQKYLSLKIGKEGKYLTGEQTYVIKYRVLGAINGFEDINELAWNVTGNEWEVPIDKASARIIFDSEVETEIGNAACYSGYFGAEEQNCEALYEGNNSFYFSATDLLAYQGLTVAAGVEPFIVDATAFLTVSAIPAEGGEFGEFGEYDSHQIQLPGYFAVQTGNKHTFRVLPGEHTVKVDKYGYKSKSQTVNVLPGEDKEIEFSLEVSSILNFLENVFPFILVLFFLLKFFWDWVKNGKDVPGKRFVVPEYVPPKIEGEYIDAGDLGIIIDQKAHLHDITAAIIGLANKGYLKVKGNGKKSFTFEKVATATEVKSLPKYQQEIMAGMFTSEKKSVNLDEMYSTFSLKLPSIRENLYERAVENGYFKENPDKIKAKYRGTGILFLAVSFILIFTLGMFIDARWYFFGLSAVGSVYIIFADVMPKRTAKGSDTFNKGMGFKKFLERVEKKKLERIYTPEQYEDVFSNFLPYAIIFGVEKKWVKVFGEMMNEAPKWFASNDFSAFRKSFNQFNKRVESSYLPRSANGSSSTSSGGSWSSSGRSFSSGGGFSGGGFGGGGGRSW